MRKKQGASYFCPLIDAEWPPGQIAEALAQDAPRPPAPQTTREAAPKSEPPVLRLMTSSFFASAFATASGGGLASCGFGPAHAWGSS